MNASLTSTMLIYRAQRRSPDPAVPRAVQALNKQSSNEMKRLPLPGSIKLFSSNNSGRLSLPWEELPQLTSSPNTLPVLLSPSREETDQGRKGKPGGHHSSWSTFLTTEMKVAERLRRSHWPSDGASLTESLLKPALLQSLEYSAGPSSEVGNMKKPGDRSHTACLHTNIAQS